MVPTDTHNEVLRAALFHSPVERIANSSNYHVVEIGVREGAYTTWVGSWDQSEQKVDAATPTSVLNEGRAGMRLKAGQAIVVKITTTGTPASLSGSRVNFTLGLVGGRDGTAKPLVAAGAAVTDANSRSAIAALERQINTGGLADWDDSVQLQDPVGLVTAGTFQGRIQRDSATQISLQRYGGGYVEVSGDALAIGSSGLLCTTTDGLLSSSGGVTSTAPSLSTLYYVYVGSPVGGSAQVRLCATAPSLHVGTYYLGTDTFTARWRFAGWARLNASTQFVDDTTDRLVVNYHHRLWKSLLLTPGYADDNAATTYTTTSTTWTAANGGTGATGSYIANGEDAIHVTAFAHLKNSDAGQVARIGIGNNSATSASVEAEQTSTAFVPASCAYSTVPATGYRTLVLLVSVSANTGTYVADNARVGSSADPVVTALYTMVPV